MYAIPAQCAAPWLGDQLWEGQLAFRVMAPETAQGAAFEKDCRADAWPIMDGEPADIKDQPASILHTYQPSVNIRIGGRYMLATASIQHCRLFDDWIYGEAGSTTW